MNPNVFIAEEKEESNDEAMKKKDREMGLSI